VKLTSLPFLELIGIHKGESVGIAVAGVLSVSEKGIMSSHPTQYR